MQKVSFKVKEWNMEKEREKTTKRYEIERKSIEWRRKREKEERTSESKVDMNAQQAVHNKKKNTVIITVNGTMKEDFIERVIIMKASGSE